jgi:molybdopterin-guanine dinucleotide biosynthesis protein A
MRVGAVVLCGGKSKRMGRSKALLPFGPELLLERMVRLVGEGISGGPIVVVAALGQSVPALPQGVTFVCDPVESRGPLQGLAAGMAALDDCVEYVYASATDAPFLEPRWPGRLLERIGDADIAMPFLEGYHHPLCALYRRGAVLPVMRALLAADRLRPVFLMEKLATVELGAADLRDLDPKFGTIRNMNTPEDYAQALLDAGFSAPEG